MNAIAASITELSAALHAKRLSSVELTQSLLDRVALLNPMLNALSVIFIVATVAVVIFSEHLKKLCR